MPIAAKMMQGATRVDSRTVISRSEAEREIEVLFPNESFPAREILDDLLRYHLLCNRASDQLEFRHQLIQEYYAAEWLYEKIECIDKPFLNKNYLNFYKWKEPFKLLMDLVKGNEILTTKILQAALEIDISLCAQLAIKAGAQAQRKATQLIQEKIANAEIPDWLEVEFLGKIENKEIKTYLAKYLNSSDIRIVERTAFLIGDSKNDTAIKLASKNLAEIDQLYFSQSSFGGADKNGDIWIKKFNAFSFLAPQLAFEYLKEKLFEPGKQAFVIMLTWHQAAETLLKLDHDKTIFRSLLERLNQPLSVDEGNNYIANMLDGSIKDEVEATQILNAIKIQPEDSVQARMLSLLREVESLPVEQKILKLLPQSGKKLRAEIAKQIIDRKPLGIAILEKFLISSDSELVWVSAIILANLKKESSLPYLLRALEASPDPHKRCQAAAALIHFAPEQVVPELLHSLRSDSESIVRREVAFTLSTFGNRDAIPELENAITHGPGLNHRILGIRGMAKLSELQPLWNLIEPKKEVCWQTAAVELLRLGQIEAKALLFDLIIDVGQEQFSVVLSLISKYADNEIIDWLIEALEHPQEYKADRYFQNRIAFALNRCDPELLGKRLPQLQDLYKRKNIHQLSWLIPATQSLCGFYNYKIFESLTDGDHHEQMSNNSQNQNIFNIGSVGALNTGDTTIQGNQVGIQNNHTTPDIQPVIAQLQELLNNLQTQNPNTTEAEALTIIDTEFTEIQTTPNHRLNNLRQQLLNPERHAQAIKATLIEVTKQQLQTNPFAVAAITYFDKLSETPNQGA